MCVCIFVCLSLYIYIYIFIHLSVNGHIGYFHVLVTVNSATMKVGVHDSFFVISVIMERYVQAMPISYLSSNSYPLVLIAINDF